MTITASVHTTKHIVSQERRLDFIFDPISVLTNGSAIIVGTLFGSELSALPSDTVLSLEISGSGDALKADYINVPRTSSESIALFRFGIRDLQNGSQISFRLTNPSGAPLQFEAAVFSDSCEYEVLSQGGFVDELPVGEVKTSVDELITATATSEVVPSGPLVVDAGGIEVVSFQQRIPVTVTLFVSPGVSGTHTVVMPFDVEFQVRIGDGDTTASAQLSDLSQPFAIPLMSSTLDLGQTVKTDQHSPAPSQLTPGRLGPTEVCGQISGDTTWEAEASPFIVSCNLTIESAAKLPIRPGVVVKFVNAGLYVDGALQVLGTEEMPVFFTSLSDDEVGGDTNGDGTASSPKAGNWNFVQFNDRSDDDNSVVGNLVIRYAGGDRGYDAVRLVNASPNLTNITYENNAGQDVENVQ